MMRKYCCLMLILCLLLSGCTFDRETLLTLPRTEEHKKLLSVQALALLTGSADYTIPTSGDMKGPALEIDLNGDGVLESVSCLLKQRGSESYPCVEIYSHLDGHTTLTAEITGNGDHIDALYFPVLDERGTVGIVIGWGLAGSSLHGLTVCAFFEDSLETLYSSSYQSLSVADMDHDGFDEIIFTSNTPGKNAYHALMLDYKNGGLRASTAASLSQGLFPQHVLTANIGFDRVALLCEGYIERYGYVTDVILCAADGTLVNVYRSELTGTSDMTARNQPIWCMDANNDGIVELPVPREVEEPSGEHSEKMTLIDWCRCDENAAPEVLYTTYYHGEEGWYMRLPELLTWNVLPVQSIDTDGVSATLFYSLSGEGERGLPLWEIYVLSGENAEVTENICSLKRLAVMDGKIYALKVYNVLYGSPYTRASLQTLFSVLPSGSSAAGAAS